MKGKSEIPRFREQLVTATCKDGEEVTRTPRGRYHKQALPRTSATGSSSGH
ncbi:MAG: hypothetical protein ACR2PX_14900 [Endozoicomonas sp.]